MTQFKLRVFAALTVLFIVVFVSACMLLEYTYHHYRHHHCHHQHYHHELAIKTINSQSIKGIIIKKNGRVQ